jgi:hypothetical protein
MADKILTTVIVEVEAELLQEAARHIRKMAERDDLWAETLYSKEQQERFAHAREAVADARAKVRAAFNLADRLNDRLGYYADEATDG